MIHRQIKLVVGKTPQSRPCLHLLMVPSLHLLITDKLFNPYTYPPVPISPPVLRIPLSKDSMDAPCLP